MNPNVLNASWCSGSRRCTTVGLVVCYNASVSDLLYQAFDGDAMWRFPPCESATKMPPDKNDWFCCRVKFKDFGPHLNRKLIQRPSWCQTKLVATLCLTWKWTKVLISLEYIYRLLKSVFCFWTTLHDIIKTHTKTLICQWAKAKITYLQSYIWLYLLWWHMHTHSCMCVRARAHTHTHIHTHTHTHTHTLSHTLAHTPAHTHTHTHTLWQSQQTNQQSELENGCRVNIKKRSNRAETAHHPNKHSQLL